MIWKVYIRVNNSRLNIINLCSLVCILRELNDFIMKSSELHKGCDYHKNEVTDSIRIAYRLQN